MPQYMKPCTQYLGVAMSDHNYTHISTVAARPIEHRTAISCLWLTYSTFTRCLFHNHRLCLYHTDISQVKVQYTATPI